MRHPLFKAILLFAVLAAGAPALGQSTENVDTDAEQAERTARIEELRGLLREERESRRADIQQRLEGLSDDQKAALQERRRMVRQSQARRQARGQGRQQPCVCPETEVENIP